MMGFSFASPLVLSSLLVLPLIYWWLRLFPPRPRLLPLPTLPWVFDLRARDQEPQSMPFWLLLVRLSLLAALILACAGPYWRAPQQLPFLTQATTNTPSVIMVDDGWAAALDWPERMARVAEIVETLPNRLFYLVLASRPEEITETQTAQEVITRLRALQPHGFLPSRQEMLTKVQSLAGADGLVLWVNDGVRLVEDEAAIAAFSQNVKTRLSFVASMQTSPLLVRDFMRESENSTLTIERIAKTAPQTGVARVLDDRARMISEEPFNFAAGETIQKLQFRLPLEVMNSFARIELVGQNSAGAVHLVDRRQNRRRVAFHTSLGEDSLSPLLYSYHYVRQALSPFVEWREATKTALESHKTTHPILTLLEGQPDVLILDDFISFSTEITEKINKFLERGGVLIRFAGANMAQNLGEKPDAFLPVKLRQGGRVLGGALSWESPRKLATFPEISPFYGLTVADDVRVERQVLAEPGADMNTRSWAMLEDGTPLITGEKRGRGHIVLFHVNARMDWSNLPISGLFVDLLRRLLTLVPDFERQEESEKNASATNIRLPLRMVLDGFGILHPAKGAKQEKTAQIIKTQEALPLDFHGRASLLHPPGLYGEAESSLALNAVHKEDRFEPFDFSSLAVLSTREQGVKDYRDLALVAAFLLFLAEMFLTAFLRGGRSLFGRARAGFIGCLLFGLAVSVVIPLGSEADAQTRSATKPRDVYAREVIRSSLRPRLAYIKTGNAQVDTTSEAGLRHLSSILEQRTSMVLDQPIGVDPARDELAFYAMIYWPVLPQTATLSSQGLRAVDVFMKQGGTIVFDTRDGFLTRKSGHISAETQSLRTLLASLDVPPLEILPKDHVLTKSFYLLETLYGRYNNGQTWVETLLAPRDPKNPVRSGDRVSPIILTNQDWAAAWAVDSSGSPLFPLDQEGERMREMTYRSGVNLMMYMMTGNYKADQIHIPAMLERLGQ